MSSMVHGWTDTHCHIHDDKMATSADESLQRARDAGVEKFVVIGTDAQTSAAAIAIAENHPDVWATVGLHPHDATNGVDSIVSYIASPKVVAIGECGLDYYYDHSPRDIQMTSFRQQIALAKQHDLTLVIHTRDAWDDTFKVLDSEGMPANTIIHCFTAQLCPADRLLIETDSPFLAPVPHRGRTNEPAHVGIVGTAIADMRHVDVAEFARVTSANALAAFPRIHS